MRRKSKAKQEVKQDRKTTKVSVYFTEEEKKMLDHFIKRFKHKTCSTYIRKLVMTEVLATLNRNYPTLFDQATRQRVPEASEEPTPAED